MQTPGFIPDQPMRVSEGWGVGTGVTKGQGWAPWDSVLEVTEGLVVPVACWRKTLWKTRVQEKGDT